jgi:TatD DNase family protein
MTITDTYYTIYIQKFDQDRDEMIQRAIEKVPDFLFLQSTLRVPAYDLEKNYPNMFSDDGTASYLCKEIFRELQHVEESGGKFYAIGNWN